MLSCDWGTSSFRLRLIDAVSGFIIHEIISDEGIHSVYHTWQKAGADESSRMTFYLSVIHRHIRQLEEKDTTIKQGLPVLISGMASSSIGIRELPYTAVPFFTDGRDMKVLHLDKQDFFGHELLLISGASTSKDVMRGEETQLIGCANKNQKGRQLFIFPGTHSKHVSTMGDTATNITTYMTGELFSMLSAHSILSASIVSSGGDEQENRQAFAQGVQTAQGQCLSHSLFLVRANQLLNRYSKTANCHYLSGLLIGAELEQVAGTAVDNITLVGAPVLAANYLQAFTILGVDAGITVADAADATIRGQLAVYRRM